MSEETKKDYKATVDQLVTDLAGARKAKADKKAELNKLLADIEAVIKRARLAKLRDDLKAEVGRLQGQEEILYARLKDEAIDYYVEEGVDKRVHPAVSVTDTKTLVITDMDAAVAHAQEHKTHLLVTKPKNISSFRSAYRKDIEAEAEYEFAHLETGHGMQCASDLSAYLPESTEEGVVPEHEEIPF